MPSTVLGAGRTKVQSLVSVACYLAEKTDTETDYYNVVNMIIEVLSTYLGSPEGEPETIWGAGKGLMRWWYLGWGLKKDRKFSKQKREQIYSKPKKKWESQGRGSAPGCERSNEVAGMYGHSGKWGWQVCGHLSVRVGSLDFIWSAMETQNILGEIMRGRTDQICVLERKPKAVVRIH